MCGICNSISAFLWKPSLNGLKNYLLFKTLEQEKKVNRICRHYANQFHLNLEGALGYLLKQKLIDDGEMRVKMAAGATFKAGIWKNR